MTAGMSHWGKINAERQQKEAEREAGREAREAEAGKKAAEFEERLEHQRQRRQKEFWSVAFFMLVFVDVIVAFGMIYGGSGGGCFDSTPRFSGGTYCD